MFDRIFELKYMPIVTPHNLLENIKLDNYESIKFTKRKKTTICELQCEIDSETVVFFYEFDENEFLQNSYYVEDGIKTYLFSREFEFKNLVKKYQEEMA